MKTPSKDESVERGPRRTPGAIDVNPGPSRLPEREDSEDVNLSHVPPEREERLPGKAEDEPTPLRRGYQAKMKGSRPRGTKGVTYARFKNG